MNLKQNSPLSAQLKIFGAYLAAAFILYAVILPTPFKSLDDFVSIVNNSHIKSLGYIPALFRNSFFGEGAYYRPLVHLSFLFEFHFFGLNAFYYNLTNVLFHALNAMGVFYVAARLLNNRRIAFWAALMFVIHPVHWEAVGNVAGRSILLSAFFILYGFLAFILFCEKKHWTWYVLSVLGFIGGLLTKENGIMFIGVIGVYLYLFQNPRRQIWIPKYALMIPYLLFIVFYLWLRAQLDIYQHVRWESFSHLMLGVGTFFYACFHFLQTLIFPIDFYFEHSHVMLTSFSDIRFWGSILFWLGAALFLFWKRQELGRVQSFFLIWIVLHFLPMMQIVPVRLSETRISTPDHFLYLPCIGFFVFFVVAARQWLKRLTQIKGARTKTWRIIVILYMSYLGIVCFTQNIYATNMFAMYKKALAHNPSNFRVRNSLAVAYAITGHLDEAEEHFKIILAEDPHYTKARIGLAETYNDRGYYWEAINEYEQIVNIESLEEFYRDGMAFALAHLLPEYTDKLKKEPQNPKVLYGLGVIYAKGKQHPEALQYLHQALELVPDYEQALFNLGVVYILEGESSKAIAYFERTIQNQAATAEDEHDQMAYYYLGQIFAEDGEIKKAEEYFAKSKEVGIIQNR